MLYCTMSSEHVYPTDYNLFDRIDGEATCQKCEELQQERGKLGKRAHRVGILRPRLALYNGDVPDETAIANVITYDVKAKPDAVIVVGTGLIIPGARQLAWDMCNAQGRGGLSVWINTREKPNDLEVDFDIEVIADCQKFARYVNLPPWWWLTQVPQNLAATEVRQLEKACGLFITQSSQEALCRAWQEVDDSHLCSFLLKNENRSRLLGIKQDGNQVFLLAVESNMLGWLPTLAPVWEQGMSERLGRESTITKKAIYYGKNDIKNDLQRLKPGTELNDEIINAYLDLIRPRLEATQMIATTTLLNQNSSPIRQNFSSTWSSIYVPIHQPGHWTFAVLRRQGDIISANYYDSNGGSAPKNFEIWLQTTFSGPTEIISGLPNPSQKNSYDCGIFVLIGMRAITAIGRHLYQDEIDNIIPRFRERALAELLASRLDPLPQDYDRFVKEESDCTEDIIDEQMVLFHGEGTKHNPVIFDDFRGEGSQHGPVKFDSEIYEASINDPIEHHTTHSDVAPEISDVAMNESFNGGLMFRTSSAESGTPGIEKRRTYVCRAWTYACNFADEVSMRNTLREAVLAKRRSSQGLRVGQHGELARLWALANTEDPNRALRLRRYRFQFSRLFWEEIQSLGGQRGTRMSKSISTQMKAKLGLDITDQNTWRSALRQAQRSSIWIDVANIFYDNLRDMSEVAICASSESTSTLESMAHKDRGLFLKKVRSRANDPHSEILRRLNAASSLYQAIIDNNLPPYLLCIESQHMDSMTFEEAVSLKEAPTVLPLRRSTSNIST
jgi:hypothetical protein